MVRLKTKYTDEVKLKLKEEFGITNALAVPKVEKIVINMGLSDAKDNQSVLEKAIDNLAHLAGQRAVPTYAKRSIANFKVVKGQTIGAMVTLRNNNMYDFLDKLINIVLPKVRDFRGVSDTAFDQFGNYTLGLNELLIFPEVDYRNVDKLRGLAISIVTTTNSKQQCKRLLELLGMPFEKVESSR